MKDVIIGIDLGGTNLRIGAVTKENKIAELSCLKSSVIAEAEDPLKALCEVIGEYIKKNRIEEPKAVSIGVPSSVANDKETVIYTTNIRNSSGAVVFQDKNIAAGLREYLNIPVFVNNDINNILLYDIAAHQLEKKKIVAGIYIGTGVGASVMIDGKMMEGKNGAEMDLGHIPYYKGDALCSCGKRGCCECYASGWRLQEIRNQYFPDTPIEELFSRHRQEPPIQEFIAACSYVFAITATIFNPDTIVAGGGVIEMAGFPKEEFEQAVYQKVGGDVMKYGFQFVYSEASHAKGVIGAAEFARRRINGRS